IGRREEVSSLSGRHRSLLSTLPSPFVSVSGWQLVFDVAVVSRIGTLIKLPLSSTAAPPFFPCGIMPAVLIKAGPCTPAWLTNLAIVSETEVMPPPLAG